MNNKKTLLVEKIKDGTVIDHIDAGKGIYVLRTLKGVEERTSIIAINVPSTNMGKKDILKIDGKYLAPKEYEEIALLCPDATIATIKDFEVTKKEKVELPGKIKGLIKCKNPVCVSNTEPNTSSEFNVVSKKPAILKCIYCEQEMQVP